MYRKDDNVFLKIAQVTHLLKWFGDPILRTPSKKIPKNDIYQSRAQELAQELISVLGRVRKLIGIGRGLAAPQIGISKRMIVIFYDHEYKVLVNPKIIWASDEWGTYQEICLSGIPMAVSVIRPWQVEIEYQDLYGIDHKFKADPVLSRILQHELDHLDGILLIDKPNFHTVTWVMNLQTFIASATLTQVKKTQ